MIKNYLTALSLLLFGCSAAYKPQGSSEIEKLGEDVIKHKEGIEIKIEPIIENQK